jgi:integrase
MARGRSRKNAYPGVMGETWGDPSGHTRPRGNIEQLPSGSLRARVYAGKDILTGDDLYLKRTIPAGPNAWAEARAACEEFARQVDQGRHPRTNATISQLIAKHLDGADLTPRVKQTLRGYARKHIDPRPDGTNSARRIGARTISEGDAQVLEGFYAELRRCRDHCDGRPTVRHRHDKNRDGCTKLCRPHKCAGLARWTVRKIHFLISAAYESAIRWGWIDTNPTRLAKVPAPPQPEPLPPTAEQAAALVNECWRWGDLGPYVWLAMTTGARRGEMCALRWERLQAVHAERGQHDCVDAGCRYVLDVRRAIAQDEEGEIEEKDTKTHQRRFIALDPETVAVLAEHRQRCADAARAIGVTLTDKHYIFAATPEGTAARKPNSWSERYERCAKRLGIDTTLKNLRHYSATELIVSGVDIRTVAGRLGHSGGGTTTLKVYAAWVAAADQLASTALLNRMPKRPPTLAEPADLAIVEPRKVHEQVAADLYGAWVNGNLTAGTELTVKGLMRSHGLTTHAAYRTITHLKHQGVLDVRNGHCSVVLPCADAENQDAENQNSPETSEQPARPALTVAPAPTRSPTEPVRLSPAPAPASTTTPAMAPASVSRQTEGLSQVVMLDLLHLGTSVRKMTTTADPTDFAVLRGLMLAAVRRLGGDLSQIEDYEMTIHISGQDEPVTTVVVAA